MTHRHMKYFNPEVMLLEEPLQDFLNTKIKEFNAGNGYKNFNDFLAEELLNTVIGFKAIFLHSVPEAEAFYKRNGFHTVEENMKPLHSIDSDFTAMYLTLREVHMNYDD